MSLLAGPFMLSWADFSPFGAMSLDWADFGASAGAPLCEESRFIGVAADGGALCCVAGPDDGASRLMPVPCALAKPVPAISAAAATDIKKRLLMEYLLVSALPAPI